MYKLQDKPDKKAQLNNGVEVTPIVTLKDEYGGIAHIIEDDHCYVLLIGSKNRKFSMTNHWFPEAVKVLKEMPIPKYVNAE